MDLEISNNSLRKYILQQNPQKINTDNLMTCSSPRQTFFYTRSHLNALQNCALFFQPLFSLFSYLNSALHNLVIKLCSAPFFKWLFSKFVHSFVAIELLNFSKMLNSSVPSCPGSSYSPILMSQQWTVSKYQKIEISMTMNCSSYSTKNYSSVS